MITVLYTCRLCGLQKVTCEVPERGDSEDIVHWVSETAAGVLAKDHERRSPGCLARKLDEVYIPMTGTDRIGGAVVQ